LFFPPVGFVETAMSDFSGEGWIHPMGGYDVYYAEGSGGQFILVCAEVDMVAVITSDAAISPDEKYLSIISDKIIPSIRR